MDPNQQIQFAQKENNPPVELVSLQSRSDRIQNKIGITFIILLFLFLLAGVFITAFEKFQLGIFFTLGVFTQAYFMLRNGFDRQSIIKLLGCIFLSFLFVFCLAGSSSSSSFSDSPAPPSLLLIPVCFVFSIFFSLMFKKELLFRINGGTLVVWNVVILYLCFLRFGFYNILTLILIILAIANFIIIASSSPPKFIWKVFLYCWLLFLMLFLSFYQFDLKTFASFILASSPPTYNPLDAIFTGMISLNIICYSIFIIVLFIPLISSWNLGEKYEFKRRLEESKKLALDLSSRYEDSQLSLLKIVFMVTITAGCLFINYYYKIISDYTLISIILIVLFNFSQFKEAPESIA